MKRYKSEAGLKILFIAPPATHHGHAKNGWVGR